MAKYLVTGGAGFIGSHLVDALIAKGHAVIVLDNLYSGKKEQVNDAAHFVLGDILDEALLATLLPQVDGCFHLAAIPSTVLSCEQWSKTHEVNLDGTIKIFEALKNLNKKIPVVYASSSAVYGECTVPLLNEKLLVHPLTPYGCDKFSCELHAYVATHLYQIPTTGLRLFNVYGPRVETTSPYSGVISLFTKQIAANKPLTIYGDGDQSRDFIYVADVVNAFMVAMSKPDVKPQVMNICRGEGTTLNQLIAILENIAQVTAIRDYVAPRVGDIYRSVGDPSYSQQALGIRCEKDVDAGLRCMLNKP